MKRGTMIGIGVLVFLIIVAFVMIKSSPAPQEQLPQIEETQNEPSIEQEQPSLSSDSDVFNEFDASIEGLS